MAIFPKIQSPCPYKGDFEDLMVGDTCKLCKKEVVDLTAWSDNQRVDYLSNCSSEVCVSYKFPLKEAAAAALVVSGMAMPTAAAAQDHDAAADMDWNEMVIIVGGLRDTKNTEYVDDGKPAADDDLEELPVVYEPVSDVK